MYLLKFVRVLTLAAILATFAFPAPKTRLEAESITVGVGGFHITKIIRPKGPFFLILRNPSNIANLAFALTRVTGEHVKDVPLDVHSEWAEVLDLTPADYILTEAGHPSWKCTITVTSH